MHRLILPALLLLMALAGCGSGDSEIIADNLVEKVFNNGEAARLELASGAYVDFPSGTFADRQVVSISDLISGSDNVPESFPTTTKSITERVGALIINSPVDALFERDISLRFALTDQQTPGTEFVLFIHDSDLGSRIETYDNDYVTWYRYGSYTATVDSSGNFATASLDSSGNRGFIGTLGLFRGLTASAMGAAETTEVRGRVLDQNGSGVSTDVELNYLIGEERFPVRLLNGSVPSGGSVASTVISDSSGNFVLQVPDFYISQIFNVSFGMHDSGHSDQDEFVVNLPHPIREDEVNNLVIRYGTNNITSEPVGTT
ncbi:hypothetical protein KDL44_15465 [bacterium]|nr:hypothetical protein [bacterium]